MADPNVTIASNSGPRNRKYRARPRKGIKLPPAAADYYLMTMRAAELELQ